MKIAAYQFAVSGDIRQNLSVISSALSILKEHGAQLVVFPECALTGYPPRDIAHSCDVDFDAVDDACAQMQEYADTLDIAFIIGTVYRENGKIYNRAILFRPNAPSESYDKRALWGWDRDNFTVGSSSGIFTIGGIKIGVRICYEIRFPEYFRELYRENIDLNIVLFYDVSDSDNAERYDLIKGHLQTRAVENVCTTVCVNAVSPFQTAPTAVFGRSGQVLCECEKNKEGFILFDFDKQPLDFGEQGRKELSDILMRK